MRRKGWLGLILAVIMVFTMTPPTAFADDSYACEIMTKDGRTTQYETVKAACDAIKDGDTLKLLKDYDSSVDSTNNFGISLTARYITIDLNGYSVTSHKESIKYGYALKVAQKSSGARDNTVTIKNSSTTRQSVLASSSYQIITGSGNGKYNQIIKIEGNIVFRDIDGETPLGIELGTGAKLLDTDSARALVPNGGFSVKEADGSSYIYGNLSNAARRSADGNIVLLHDYEGSDKIASGSKDSVLDLDGHTYTYTGNGSAIDVNYPNVTLTVKNGKIVVTDENTAGAVLIGKSAGGIESSEGNMNNRGLILDGVELTVPGDTYGIATNGTETGNTVMLKNSVLNVKNGLGIYFPSDGDVIIEDSTINAKHAGVQICAGNLTVTGETVITVTGQPQEKTDNDGAIADGAAVSIINREGYKDLGTVNIESGTFNSAADVEVVKAYSFNNANKTEDEWAEAGDTVNVKGGSFSSDIAENIVKSDMKATVTSGGETTVVIGKQAVENAIAELKAGDKIEFQSVADDTDVKIPEGVEVTNSTGSDMTINNVTVADGVTAIVKKPEPTEPTNPSNPSTDKPTTGDQEQTTGDKVDADKESDSPKTGDDTMVLGYVIMMLAALGIGGTLAVNRKKN
ncbi:LPXTG cell wall anchor domain-containing protein [Gallibacter intestinalis]|uniref:LPXTG cell wall anchor domain-containing protein n=1 Tax=Gallibacter intestinalis TaxID=2779356 RepID=A0ABR9QVG4_9FIRM|nr:LPXTG cell wall anchor domain-containing protein [Gallibacter intestinalis]MBE5034878.1 LPXTG cell wall anchor domain-containing protein [Gallibacter intestinalis]